MTGADPDLIGYLKRLLRGRGGSKEKKRKEKRKSKREIWKEKRQYTEKSDNKNLQLIIFLKTLHLNFES